MSPQPSPWRASLTSQRSDDLRKIIAEYVDLQRNYLRNPLPPGPWVCPVCRGVRATGFPLCYPCQSHREAAGDRLADLVIPISYSPRTGQHHHNLRAYKTQPSSRRARRDLLALLLYFLHRHLPCIAARIGGKPTHIAVVPSTSGRTGEHPLAMLIGTRIGLPAIIADVNPSYSTDNNREFRSDWFAVSLPQQITPVRVLLLEDTWTTGAHAQSMAYALKTAGAAAVATIVLGRHINPDYPPSEPLLSAISDRLFDPDVCVAEQDR